MNELVPGIVIKSTAVIDGPGRVKGCGRSVLKRKGGAISLSPSCW